MFYAESQNGDSFHFERESPEAINLVVDLKDGRGQEQARMLFSEAMDLARSLSDALGLPPITPLAAQQAYDRICR